MIKIRYGSAVSILNEDSIKEKTFENSSINCQINLFEESGNSSFYINLSDDKIYKNYYDDDKNFVVDISEDNKVCGIECIDSSDIKFNFCVENNFLTEKNKNGDELIKIYQENYKIALLYIKNKDSLFIIVKDIYENNKDLNFYKDTYIPDLYKDDDSNIICYNNVNISILVSENCRVPLIYEVKKYGELYE